MGFLVEVVLLFASPRCRLDQVGALSAPRDKGKIQVLEAEDIANAISTADLRDHKLGKQFLMRQHVEDLPGREKRISQTAKFATNSVLDGRNTLFAC